MYVYPCLQACEAKKEDVKTYTFAEAQKEPGIYKCAGHFGEGSYSTEWRIISLGNFNGKLVPLLFLHTKSNVLSVHPNDTPLKLVRTDEKLCMEVV